VERTSPTKTIGDDAKAWQGVWPPAQLQAEAGRMPAATTNDAARRVA